jgi:hypothetical protein
MIKITRFTLKPCGHSPLRSLLTPSDFTRDGASCVPQVFYWVYATEVAIISRGWETIFTKVAGFGTAKKEKLLKEARRLLSRLIRRIGETSNVRDHIPYFLVA